jgi:hypothetical protein
MNLFSADDIKGFHTVIGLENSIPLVLQIYLDCPTISLSSSQTKIFIPIPPICYPQSPDSPFPSLRHRGYRRLYQEDIKTFLTKDIAFSYKIIKVRRIDYTILYQSTQTKKKKSLEKGWLKKKKSLKRDWMKK